MSLKIDRVQLEIVINNDQARKSLRALDDEARLLTKEMKKLKEGTEEYAQKAARLKSIKVQQDAIYESIGITNMTMKELSRRQSELNSILMHMRPGTEEYKKLKAEVTAITGRIGELKGKSQATGFSIKGMADGFNRYFAMATTFAASITGMVIGFKKISEEVAHLDDVYSDVMKTTQLTRDEVLALNEEFKKMDTRTSRESLNNLASDAGKLGIEGSDAILNFVDAGNQINVALGEDLGEDAIKNIGKMVGVFEAASTELQNLDLKEQMLAVGSAINDIGASSSASEPYLVNFAGRLGGIAKQAKISLSAIIGYGSALDQDMQQVEMSATAFSNFIMKLMEDPAKFARLAGLEVKSFTKLLNTDANAAIKQVLTSMNQQGGFQALIPIFSEMGLDGSRAVAVLSSMAGSIGKIDEAQKIANKSMLDGTSITNEYNIKNNNLQATLDKARKNFLEKALALGEKLTPALIQSTNAFSYLIKALTEAPAFIKRNEVAIIVLAGAFLALQAAKIKVIAATLWGNITMQAGIGLKIKDAVALQFLIIKEQMHAAMIGKTTIAQKAAAVASVTLRNALALIGGPIGAIIIGFTAIVAAVKLWDKNNAGAIARQRELNATITDYDAIITSLNETLDKQKSKIAELNRLSATEKQDLRDKIQLSIEYTKAKLLELQIKEAELKKDNTRATAWQTLRNSVLSYGNAVLFASLQAKDAVNNGAEATEPFKDRLKDLESQLKEFESSAKSLDDILKAESIADSIGTKSIGELEEKIKFLQVALKNVAVDSEDYTRINGKLTEANNQLSKATNKVVTDLEKQIGAHARLSKQIGDLEEKIQNLVAANKPVPNSYLHELAQKKDQLEQVNAYVKEIAAGLTTLKAIDKPAKVDVNAGDFSSIMQPAGEKNSGVQPDLPPESSQSETDARASQIGQAAISGAESTQNAIFSIIRDRQQSALDHKLQMLNKQMEAELKNDKLTNEEREKIKSKYAAKERKAKQDAWRKQHSADMIQAVIKGALAIITAMSQGGLWMAIPAGIAVGAEMAVMAAQKVPQFAKGRYKVTGADDGKTYYPEFAGKVQTKIYSKPSLVAEQGDELIIDSATTRNLVMNYPEIVEAIYTARVPQRAKGSYPDMSDMPKQDTEMKLLLNRLNDNLEKGIKTKFYLHDLEKEQAKLDLIETDAAM